MQIIVQGHGIEVTSALREYANKKIGKVEQFFHNIQKAEVILDARHNKDTDRSQVAEVSMWVAGKKVLRATAVGQDMYASIDLVFEKLEEQIKKHKAKHINVQRRKAQKIKEGIKEASLSTATIQESMPSLVRMSRSIGKPLHEDEATFEIKSSNEEFHFYRDANTHDIHVICKKGKKGFEVITPNSAKVKTMEEDAAQTALGKKKNNFLPFINPSSGEINIIYRKNSGNFGLIEPQA